MHLISANIYQFVQEALNGKHKIDSTLLDQFAEQSKGAVKRQLERGNRSAFSVYLSNIGRPLCALQMEQLHGRQSSPNVIRNIFGDMIEALVILLLRCSGIDIVSEQAKVTLETEVGVLRGKSDVVLNLNGEHSVWDIKSASDYSFRKYQRGGFADLAKNDPFGYVAQLFGYAKALDLPAGGWIIASKSSGEVLILEVPKGTYGEYSDRAIAHINSNHKSLVSKQPFRKLYEDEPEFFNKKATGNRILSNACSMCEFAKLCWPGMVIKPNVNSKSKSAALVYYSEEPK